LNRLCFRAKKLGRSWAAYTHQLAAVERQLVALQDAWTGLTFQFAPLVDPQRVSVLVAFVQGLALDNKRSTEQKRAYLLRQQADRPWVLGGFARERTTLYWLSPGAYVVHSLEELTDTPLKEREQLHDLLVGQLDDAEFSLARLAHLLSFWLAARNGPNWKDLRASSP
jgi:hypothetical protein